MNGVGELRRGWPVIVACFATALHAWGFGFYGLSVFVARLQLEQGWSTGFVSAATTVFYLVGALLLTWVPAALQRVGPRAVLLGGGVCMAAGAIVAGHATAPWQMVAGFLVMGVGWSATSVAAIAATLALWFEARRGLAISLALNGASAAGFTVAPALVWLADEHGLARSATWLALGMLAALVPLVLVGTARPRLAVPDAAARAVADGDPRPGFASQGAALRSLRFWSVAGPFTIIIMAQVGLIVHLVSFLLPVLGPRGAGLGMALMSLCAVLGRVGLGVVIDRLHQRQAAAAGLLVQAAGIVLMLALPASPAAIYAGCTLFGLWVGNNITLPSLIVGREFASGSFGLVLGLSTAIGQAGYAFSPALLGLVHDSAGGYAAVLVLVAAMTGTGAVLLLASGPRQPRQGVPYAG